MHKPRLWAPYVNRENPDGKSLPDPDDREVFEAFCGAHRRGVERFVQTRLATNQADIEDVCADVFVVAWRRFSEVRTEPEAAARSWLLRVAELRCLTQRRSGLRRDRAYERVELQPMSDDLLEDLYIDKLQRRAEAQSRVEPVLASLTPSYVEVLRLDRSGRLSGEQMAEILGISHTALRVRLTRARRAFRTEHDRQFPNDSASGGEAQ